MGSIPKFGLEGVGGTLTTVSLQRLRDGTKEKDKSMSDLPRQNDVEPMPFFNKTLQASISTGMQW